MNTTASKKLSHAELPLVETPRDPKPTQQSADPKQTQHNPKALQFKFQVQLHQFLCLAILFCFCLSFRRSTESSFRRLLSECVKLRRGRFQWDLLLFFPAFTSCLALQQPYRTSYNKAYTFRITHTNCIQLTWLIKITNYHWLQFDTAVKWHSAIVIRKQLLCICLHWQRRLYVLQLIVNTITVKISVGFFRFPSNSKEFKKWECLIRLNSLIDTNVIAIVNKKAVNRTVSFDEWASAT